MAETAEQKAAREANEKRAADAKQREADRVAQAEKDQKASEARPDNVTTNNPRAPEAIADQHRQVDEAREKLNERNREGHERNMERIETEANEAQARTEHAADHRANHIPTGKQDNRNTPIVNKDGSKVWL